MCNDQCAQLAGAAPGRDAQTGQLETYVRGLSDERKQVLSALLAPDPLRRPAAADLLLHPAFRPPPRLRLCVLQLADACSERPRPLAEGIECNGLDEEKHFTCHACFAELVTNYSTDYDMGQLKQRERVLGTTASEYKPVFTTRETTANVAHLAHNRVEGQEDPECGGHYQSILSAADVADLAESALATCIESANATCIESTHATSIESALATSTATSPHQEASPTSTAADPATSSPEMVPCHTNKIKVFLSTGGRPEETHGQTRVTFGSAFTDTPAESVIWCGSTLIGEVMGRYRDGYNQTYRLIVGYNDPNVFYLQRWAYKGKICWR